MKKWRGTGEVSKAGMDRGKLGKGKERVQRVVSMG